jgi:hypothetical protein
MGKVFNRNSLEEETQIAKEDMKTCSISLKPQWDGTI